MKELMFFVCSLKMGGSEKACVRMANALCSSFDITICTVFGGGELEAELDKSIKISCVFPQFIRGIAHMLCLLPPWAAYRLCVKDNYDIEIAVGDGLESHIISGSKNTEKYSWVHMDVRYHGDEKNAKTDKRYASYKKIICVSEVAKNGFLQKYGFEDKLTVAYTPIDSAQIIRLSQQQGDILPPNAFISVGRLEKVKGYDRLIEAAAKLNNNDLKIYIYGDGTQRQALCEQINALNLQNNIFIMGQTNNPYPMIKNAKCLICSSLNESFGFTLVEAMLLNTPVLATRCGGTEEILSSPELGILCDNSIEGIAEGLASFLHNNAQINISAALSAAMQYSTDICERNFYNIIK